LEENAPEGSSTHVSLGSNVPLPCVVKVTVPAGGTRAASGPESVTVGTQEDAVPGESPFGVQLIESVVGFAATATLGESVASLRSRCYRRRCSSQHDN
jgi:hypothetical protein